MVSSPLEIILEELGKTSLLALPNLVPDRNNSCLLKFPNGLRVQIELDKTEQYLLIVSKLGEVPLSGTYRLDLLRAALRANDVPYPRIGIFAYSTKNKNLILFDQLPMNEIDGSKVATYLKPFMEKANLWLTAMKENQLPSASTESSGLGLKALLGLR